MKVLIIGGVAGGASTAARLRRLDEQAEIIILERGEYVSFANCGLPYYIGGVITRQDDLLLQTPESFDARFNVKVRNFSEAIAINPQAKTVTVRNHQTNETYEESYDKLILSPGAEPTKPYGDFSNSQRVFTLRNMPDTFKIKAFLAEHSPKSAIVIGGGYIGLEMMENLAHAGLQVTLLQRSRHVLRNTLDYDMACQVHNQIRTKGIRLFVNQAVQSITEGADAVQVEATMGTLTADLVIVAAGVAPDTAIAKAAGIALNSRGYIIVNDQMQTGTPDIYAVGDAVEVTHFVSGKQAAIPLAGPANKQGRIAADNLCGIPSRYKGTQGTSILQCCGLTIAATGMTEATLKQAEIPYVRSYTFSSDHAGYYPNSQMMGIKLLFSPDQGKILGAQLVGPAGVDKRCDVIATAIRADMTVYDLTELELAYAPPYSSAKDPVNMAGYVAENLLTGKLEPYYWDEVDALDPKAVTILDVVTPKEFKKGHLPGAINIPIDELRSRLAELDKAKPVYLNCYIGLRGYIAYRMLKQHGFTCRSLSGGYRLWSNIVQNEDYEF